MKKSVISVWADKYKTKIILILFLIEWCIVIFRWIFQNPRINIISFLNYFLWLLYMLLQPYIAKNYFEILVSKTKNFDLLYSINLWILVLIVEFIEFNDISFKLIIFLTMNFCFGLTFIVIHAYKFGSCFLLVLNILMIVFSFFETESEFYNVKPMEPLSIIIIFIINISYGIIRIHKIKKS